MPYTIYQSDGTPITVPDNAIDTEFYNPVGGGGVVYPTGQGLGIQLLGRNTLNYGASVAQNFLQLSENFCSSSPPSGTFSLQGQLWFNQLSTTNGNLYVKATQNTTSIIGTDWIQLLTSTSSAPSANVATNIAGGGAGSIPYQTAASTTAMLPIGPNGYVLSSTSGLPTWESLSSFGVTSFNTRTGNVVLTSGDVETALGFTPAPTNGVGAFGTWGISIAGNSLTSSSTNQVVAVTDTTNAVFPVPFVSGNTGLVSVYTNASYGYNPATNTLTAGTFSGNATSATNATNAVNAVSATNAVNATNATTATTAITANNLNTSNVAVTLGAEWSIDSNGQLSNNGNTMEYVDFYTTANTTTGSQILFNAFTGANGSFPVSGGLVQLPAAGLYEVSATFGWADPAVANFTVISWFNGSAASIIGPNSSANGFAVGIEGAAGEVFATACIKCLVRTTAAGQTIGVTGNLTYSAPNLYITTGAHMLIRRIG